MLKSQCLVVCLCFFVVSSYGNLVPFIDKCEWSDKACLLASTTKAIPYFAKGLPDFEMPPMDPLHMNEVTLSEGDLKLDFSNMVVTGASKCKMLKVEREISNNLLRLEAECPIEVSGEYEASGKLFVTPVEGKGPFHVDCKLLFVSVDAEIVEVISSDGLKHWIVGNTKHTFDAIERTTFRFDNLFNGDESKAAPVLTILNENWKEVLLSVGKPIVDEVLHKIINLLRIFCANVPADQLEL